jgi:TPR repeat protein
MRLLFVSLLLALSACTPFSKTPPVAPGEFATTMTAEELQAAVLSGNTDAMLTLGYAYLRGELSLPKDSKKAIELFTQAAKKGNVDAQYNLGLMYVRGEGLEKSLTKAAPWFERAAMQGDAGAQYNTGLMYFNGEGTKRDLVKASFFLRLAAEQKYEGARGAMVLAVQQLSPDIVATLDAKFEEFKKKVKREG